MRIWSIHPVHLDAKGLVALWREGLLALHVLEGRTKGYTRHPQLKRFRDFEQPIEAINHYLSEVVAEAERRGYHFDRSKITPVALEKKIPVTLGQVEYEAQHLLHKLEKRDKAKYEELRKLARLLIHPLFEVREGGVEEWEIIDQNISLRLHQKA